MGTAPTAPPEGESFAALFESAPDKTPRRRVFSSGDELDVTVVQIGRDAVFVELDGKQEGFIEAKDLTTRQGQLAVKIGSRVAARVVEVGGRPGAVRLVPLLVHASKDDEGSAPGTLPGLPSSGALAVGVAVKGKVALVERYGVFVELPGGHGRRAPRGLVPVSELGVPRGVDLHKVFPLGTELEAKIIAIDERGRIKLSVVALHAEAEQRDFEAHRERPGANGGAPVRGFGTLGDLLARRR